MYNCNVDNACSCLYCVMIAMGILKTIKRTKSLRRGNERDKREKKNNKRKEPLLHPLLKDKIV